MVTKIKKGTPITEIKKKIDLALNKKSKSDLEKLSGSIKLSVDPIDWQKEIRNEWK